MLILNYYQFLGNIKGTFTPHTQSIPFNGLQKKAEAHKKMLLLTKCNFTVVITFLPSR